MIFSEILVLFLALVISITLVLMLRKLFFGRKSKIQIDKKVNSRELFEPVGSENSEREVFQDNDLEKLSENGDLDSSQEGEIENTQSEMLTLHLENSEESKFSYDAIKKFLGSNKIEYNDEGGWFKILIEENDSFLLIILP